jgi:hypothetical protein
MTTAEKVQEVLDHEIVVGQTRLLGARVRFGEDSDGEPVLFVRFILSNPPEGLETWPTEDINAIRRNTRDAIVNADAGLLVPWVISFEPEAAVEIDPDDATGEVHIDF